MAVVTETTDEESTAPRAVSVVRGRRAVLVDDETLPTRLMVLGLAHRDGTVHGPGALPGRRRVRHRRRDGALLHAAPRAPRASSSARARAATRCSGDHRRPVAHARRDPAATPARLRPGRRRARMGPALAARVVRDPRVACAPPATLPRPPARARWRRRPARPLRLSAPLGGRHPRRGGPARHHRARLAAEHRRPVGRRRHRPPGDRPPASGRSTSSPSATAAFIDDLPGGARAARRRCGGAASASASTTSSPVCCTWRSASTSASRSDPLLPPELLPRPWPGKEARDLLARCRKLGVLAREDKDGPALYRVFDDAIAHLP